MPTLNLQIGAGDEDAEQGTNGTGFTHSSNNVSVRNDTTPNMCGGFVFKNVTIPVGATINAATIEPFLRTAGDDPELNIHCEDVDSADDFGVTGDIVNRLMNVTTGVLWSATAVAAPSDQFVESPDISAPVQAIVDRAGWSDGNDVCLLMEHTNASSKIFLARSYDFSAATAAKLNIDYTAGGGGGNRRRRFFAGAAA